MNTKGIFDRPIAYHRIFADYVGACGAIFLSQAFYWNYRTKDPEGWFYKTREEWTEETGLTRYEQETARKAAKKLGILDEKLAGNPAQLHYRVNIYAVSRLLETNQLVGGKPTNKKGGNQPTIYTETTTEITNKDLNPIVKTTEDLEEELGDSLSDYKRNKEAIRAKKKIGFVNSGFRFNKSAAKSTIDQPKRGGVARYGIDP